MQKSENKTSAAKLAANQRYIENSTDLIKARLPKGYKDKLHIIAESQGVSMAGFIKNCIDTAYNEIAKE